jgi:hypothetical protein
VTRSRAEEYRRRSRQCLEIARTLSPGMKRAILTDMAQTWLQLAEEQEAALPPSAVEDRPVMQQQQQVQPKHDDKKRNPRRAR